MLIFFAESMVTLRDETGQVGGGLEQAPRGSARAARVHEFPNKRRRVLVILEVQASGRSQQQITAEQHLPKLQHQQGARGGRANVAIVQAAGV